MGSLLDAVPYTNAGHKCKPQSHICRRHTCFGGFQVLRWAVTGVSYMLTSTARTKRPRRRPAHRTKSIYYL